MRSLVTLLSLPVVAISFGAQAADLPYKAPPPTVVSVYSWTGCYVGVEGGGAWGRSQHFQNEPASASFGLAQTGGIDLSGGLIGGTVGCNYQFGGNWVIGVEGDMSWTSKEGSAPTIAPFTPGENFRTDESWISTVRGRLGYAWDRWLVYGTGGVAFADEGIRLCDLVAGCVSASSTVTGWVAGAGVEYAFWANWSVKVEYLHADFGNQSYGRLTTPALFANGSTFFAARNVSLTDDIVRVGLNYRF